MSHVWAFVQLTRPLFLMGGVILYGLGAWFAFIETGTFHLARFLTGQILVTAVQLMTHYFNEYYDIQGDRLNQARTWFSGGSGILASGALPLRAAWQAGLGMAVVAGLALAIAAIQVPLALAFGAFSLLAAWSYSGPPLRLSGTGWGEISASVVVALMVPLVGYTMQAGGGLNTRLLAILLPLVLIHFAMLIAFQIPDAPADQAAGKRTLAVRLGLEKVTRLHNLALVLAFSVILGLWLGGWREASLAWLALPLALWQSATIRKYLGSRPPEFLGLTMRAIGLFALTSMLWLAGQILSWL
jgi:1,4-dihydroxy-2-naphthoate octaprenyltransferase